MNLGRVIGTVWATQKYPGIEDTPILLVQPLDGDLEPAGQPLAALDCVGAGRTREIIFYITSYEAVLATGKRLVPVDAAICGIVDYVERHACRERGIEGRTLDAERELTP